MNFLYLFLEIIATVVVFIFSIHKFSRQIDMVVGPKFKEMLRTATKTPLRGTIAGTIFTAIIQSSSATTLMLIGLVDAGVISFYSSLGVVFGANLGTTVTSQLIAFNVIAIAPFLVIAGFLLGKFENIFKRYSKLIFYLGLVFLSLIFISNILEPLKSDPLIISWLAKISGVAVAVAVGIIITFLFQSSSVVSGLCVLLVVQGILNFDQAFGIILGANIGTTSTSLIASLVMGHSARKTALAHFLFNVIGVLIFLPFFGLVSKFATSVAIKPEVSVALALVLFNLVSVIVALIFVKSFYSLIEKLASIHFYKKEESRAVI